jgi:hypothetical protein
MFVALANKREIWTSAIENSWIDGRRYQNREVKVNSFTYHFFSSFLEEQGPESIPCIMRLYDISSSPWRLGSYILRCMPKKLANEVCTI